MSKAVFGVPGDPKGILPSLRNLYARLSDFRGFRKLTRAGTDTERIGALEDRVDAIVAKLIAVTKE